MSFFLPFIAFYLESGMWRMENEILIGSNSNLIVSRLEKDLKLLSSDVKVRIIDDLSQINAVMDRQLVIIDLSVYTPGIIDRLEQFKQRLPQIELVAVTYETDEFIDQMLIRRGVDQVASQNELGSIVKQYLNPPLQTTG